MLLSGFLSNQQKFWQTDFCLWQKFACHRLIRNVFNNLESKLTAACQNKKPKFSKTSLHAKTELVSIKNVLDTLLVLKCFACKKVASFVKLVRIDLSKERIRLQNNFTNSKSEENLKGDFTNSKPEENFKDDFTNSKSKENLDCKTPLAKNKDLIFTNFSWLCSPKFLPNSITFCKNVSHILWRLFLPRIWFLQTKLKLWHSFSTFSPLLNWVISIWLGPVNEILFWYFKLWFFYFFLWFSCDPVAESAAMKNLWKKKILSWKKLNNS